MRRISTLFGAVSLLVGLALLAAVAIVTVNSLDRADGIRVEGVVVEANDNQKPVVEFRTREGQRIRIEGGISASPTPYRVGERIGVFYDPADPSEALIDSFLERWFLSLLFGGFATVFTLVGLGFTVAGLRRRRRQNRLMRSGMRIEGVVAGFEQSRFAKVNGRRSWHVIVDWTDPKGRRRRERSAMRREDPARNFKIGDRIVVLTDPDDTTLFWIDLEGRSATSPAGFGGTSANISTGRNDGMLGKTGANPIVRRR